MPPKILIVEDHQDSREVLAFMLRHMGYEVIEAASGPEGIEKAMGQGPDVIIMDLGLPGINGIDATVKLKQDPKTAHIPVIAHSAWSEGQYRAAAVRAGMVEYLPKPTAPAVFREALQKILHSQGEASHRPVVFSLTLGRDSTTAHESQPAIKRRRVRQAKDEPQ